MTDWTIIRRSMTGRMFSTVTTVLTVGVAVALMLVLLAMQGAGRRAFERGSGNMHLLASADASPLVAILNGIFYANAPRRPLTWAQFDRVARSAPWEYAVPTQYGDSFMGLPVLATNTDFFARFQPNPGSAWRLREGRFFEAPFEVVVGARAARATGLKVGDTIHLTHGAPQSRDLGDASAVAPHVHTEYDYHVVGILEPTGGSHDRALFTDLSSAWIIHAHDRRVRENPGAGRTTQEHLTDADRLITGIYLRLVTRAGSDTPANLPQVFDQLRRDATLTIAQPKQELDRLFLIVGNVNELLVAIAAVVLVSSGIAIMLALYNSMEQRRRQIAVLRVLGASRSRIFGLVTTEAALIGMLGAVVGIALSAVGAAAAAGVMKTRLGLDIDAALPPREIVRVVLIAVALSTLAGFVPAMMAYRTSVAKNLRPIA
ncbi:MAG: ABC transporter permease [Phycisphaerales bacterium]|nr:ABC transporter permease [Phycisphaerales bacterium]